MHARALTHRNKKKNGKKNVKKTKICDSFLNLPTLHV